MQFWPQEFERRSSEIILTQSQKEAPLSFSLSCRRVPVLCPHLMQPQRQQQEDEARPGRAELRDARNLASRACFEITKLSLYPDCCCSTYIELGLLLLTAKFILTYGILFFSSFPLISIFSQSISFFLLENEFSIRFIERYRIYAVHVIFFFNLNSWQSDHKSGRKHAWKRWKYILFK